MRAQDRPDLTDHARLVGVADDDHRALERCFDADAVHQHQTRPLALNHGTFDQPFTGIGLQLHGYQAGVVARARAARLDDFDATLGCDASGIHHRHGRRENWLEESGQHGVDDHVGPHLGQLSVVADPDGEGPAVAHLCDEGAEPFGECDERLESGELLGRHGREIHRIADDTGFQEVAQRRHRFDADQLLAFPRRGGDVRTGDHLRKHLQPVIDRRLLLEDVERGASHLS